MSRPHIQKGMLLQGGAHPAHMLAFDNSVLIARTPRQYTPPYDPAPLDEIKSRLQRVQEALAFIREETQDEWLKRNGYL